MNADRRAALLLLSGVFLSYVVLVGLALASAVSVPARCACGLASSVSWGTWLGLGASAALLALGVRVGIAATMAVRRSVGLVRSTRLGRRTVDGVRVQLLSGDQPRAFCVGGLRPMIAVTAAFFLLPADERRAVLAHEAAHARFRDPLMFAILDSLARMLPLLAPLASEHRRRAEFSADDAARSEVGDSAFASALSRGLASASIGADFSPTEARVRRLLGRPYGSARAPLLAAASLFAGLLIVLGSGFVGTRHAAAREATICSQPRIWCQAERPRPVPLVCVSTPHGTACLLK